MRDQPLRAKAAARPQSRGERWLGAPKKNMYSLKKKQKVKKEKKEKVKKAKDSTEPEFKKTKAVTANKPSEARQYFHFNEEINGAECKLCQIKLSNNIKVIRTHLRYKQLLPNTYPRMITQKN